MTEFQPIERTQPLDETRIAPPEKGFKPPPYKPAEEKFKPPPYREREEEVSPEVSEAELQANTWVIKTCVEALGNTAYHITQVEAARCEDISEPLGVVWAPLMPSLSPITRALVVTVSLIAPKVGIVIMEMRKQKAEKSITTKPKELE